MPQWWPDLGKISRDQQRCGAPEGRRHRPPRRAGLRGDIGGLLTWDEALSPDRVMAHFGKESQ
ncbi:hypothetical protein NKH18_12280 [Streptomyces sp. M10(2022)]